MAVCNCNALTVPHIHNPKGGIDIATPAQQKPQAAQQQSQAAPQSGNSGKVRIS